MTRTLRHLATLAVLLTAALAQGQIPQHRLYAEYSAGGVGAGVDASALLGAYVESAGVNASGDTLVFMLQGPTSTTSEMRIAFSDVRVSTDLTDFPPTRSANMFLRVDAAGDRYVLIDEPTPAHAIPNVGQIPAVTADSPDLVFLTHDITYGVRDDAVLTVGFGGGEAGFNDDPNNSFGSISETSPIDAFYGLGVASDYSLQVLESFNEGWINSIDSTFIDGTPYAMLPVSVYQGLFQRRLQNNPTGLSAAELDLNFKLTNDRFYFTDATDSTIYAGLYEKVDGEYRRLTSKGFVHVDGIGEPSELPTAPAQSYVDDLGRMWISGDRREVLSGSADITSAQLWTHARFGQYDHFQLLELNGDDGDFIQEIFGFSQKRGAAAVSGQTWDQVWEYIVGIDDTPANRAFRDDYVFLGIFQTVADAAEARNRHTDASKTYLYTTNGNVAFLFEILGFTSTPTTYVDHYFWRGPATVADDVIDIILEQVDPDDDDLTPNADLDRLTIGTRNYRVIVRPDSATGILRAVTSADFDSVHGKSLSVAFDGDRWYKAARYQQSSGTPATATWTEVSDGTQVTSGSRWRGAHYHDSDVSSPRDGDFYYHLGDGQFRRRTSGFWLNSLHHSELFGSARYVGHFPSQAAATSHATGNSQYATFYQNGRTRLFRSSNYNAPSGAVFEYHWVGLEPGSVPGPGQPNVTLLDREALTGWSSTRATTDRFTFSRGLVEADSSRILSFTWGKYSSTEVYQGDDKVEAGPGILAKYLLDVLANGPTVLDTVTGALSQQTGYLDLVSPSNRSPTTYGTTRLIYTGKKLADANGPVELGHNEITVHPISAIEIGQKYWIMGTLTDGSTFHREKVLVTGISGSDMVVTRGVDGSTEAPQEFETGTDIFHDDSATFVLHRSNTNQRAARLSVDLITLESLLDLLKEERLLPENASDGQFARYNGTTGVWEAVDDPGPNRTVVFDGQQPTGANDWYTVGLNQDVITQALANAGAELEIVMKGRWADQVYTRRIADIRSLTEQSRPYPTSLARGRQATFSVQRQFSGDDMITFHLVPTIPIHMIWTDPDTLVFSSPGGQDEGAHDHGFRITLIE